MIWSNLEVLLNGRTVSRPAADLHGPAYTKGASVVQCAPLPALYNSSHVCVPTAPASRLLCNSNVNGDESVPNLWHRSRNGKTRWLVWLRCIAVTRLTCFTVPQLLRQPQGSNCAWDGPLFRSYCDKVVDYCRTSCTKEVISTLGTVIRFNKIPTQNRANSDSWNKYARCTLHGCPKTSYVGRAFTSCLPTNQNNNLV